MSESVPSIVVVDDNAAALSLYELSASSLACRLHTFRNAEESLAHLVANGADLLIVDLLVRDIDGLTLIKRVREIDPERRIPVVVVTSKDYQQDRSVASELGVVEYLLKPLRGQEIRELIQRHTHATASDRAVAR